MSESRFPCPTNVSTDANTQCGTPYCYPISGYTSSLNPGTGACVYTYTYENNKCPSNFSFNSANNGTCSRGMAGACPNKTYDTTQRKCSETKTNEQNICPSGYQFQSTGCKCMKYTTTPSSAPNQWPLTPACLCSP